MKKLSSKLAVRKETIRTLAQLAGVVGGIPTTTGPSRSCVDACPTRPCTTPLPPPD
jgi:hypothetical protein